MKYFFKVHKLESIILFSILFALLFFLGCSKNPMDNLVNPTSSMALNAWGPQWVLYDEKLNTDGGTIMTYTDFTDQTLDLSYKDNDSDKDPDGVTCIKIAWDGNPVYIYSTKTTSATSVSFGLIVAKNSDLYDTTNGKDISGGNYNKLVFSAKGSLSSDTYLIVKGPNGGGLGQPLSPLDITSSWKEFKVDTSNEDLSNVKTFAIIKLMYLGYLDNTNTNHGRGGTVYIDNIKLVKE